MTTDYADSTDYAEKSFSFFNLLKNGFNMINNKYLYSDITEKIIACALKVHKKLGNGYREEVYQRCLAIEFDKISLPYEREIEIPIYYDNFKVGVRRADFVVEKKIIVETKAIRKLENDDWAQAINYLEVFKYEVGLLINFGSKSLEFKRFINSKKNTLSVKSA